MNLGRPGSPRTRVFSSLQSERNSLTTSVYATPFCCCFVFGNRVSLCYPYLSRNLIFRTVCWLVSMSTWHKVESFWKNVLEPRKLLALRRQGLEVQGPAWFTEGVPRQPGPQRETVLKNKKQNKTEQAMRNKSVKTALLHGLYSSSHLRDLLLTSLDAAVSYKMKQTLSSPTCFGSWCLITAIETLPKTTRLAYKIRDPLASASKVCGLKAFSTFFSWLPTFGLIQNKEHTSAVDF